MEKRRLNILLVEDDAGDIALIMEALNKSEVEVSIRVLTNGEEAIDYLQLSSRFLNNNGFCLPDIVFLDLNLPKKSGLEILDTMQQDSVLETIPVIMLSGSDQERDIAAANAYGAYGYVMKTPNFENLDELLNEICVFWSKIYRTEKTSIARKKVLIVDDEEQVVDLLSARFEASDYEVAVARNGEEALEEARREQPDLIIADIFMPVMNGITFVQCLKEDETLSRVPVFLITGKMIDEREWLSYGNVKEYFAKPFAGDELIRTSKRYLT